jgi:hypothetical protein
MRRSIFDIKVKNSSIFFLTIYILLHIKFTSSSQYLLYFLHIFIVKFQVKFKDQRYAYVAFKKLNSNDCLFKHLHFFDALKFYKFLTIFEFAVVFT